MFNLPAFSIGQLPRIEFGSGSIRQLPRLLSAYGSQVLLVTGHSSFLASAHWHWLQSELEQQRFQFVHLTIDREPSPEMIDDMVRVHAAFEADVVLGIGGGSVLDGAKALAGLLRTGRTIMDHLEGVGPELPYAGPCVPFIAVPTTAGTGSEATKNAVITRQGPDGFKKSFRDDRLMAAYAVLDPDLLHSCPKHLIAANGMDALTQLIEAFVSTRSNPITDALALSGISMVGHSLIPWYNGELKAAPGMAYASLLSGICLAQAGLGSVHGLAQPLGSLFPIGHGVVCGTLLAQATRSNLDVMNKRDPLNHAIKKYADIGRDLGAALDAPDESAHSFLIERLDEWTETMALPNLTDLGVKTMDIPRIVAQSRGSSMKTNPITLTDDEIALILANRLN